MLHEESPLIPTSDFARLVGVTPETVRRWVKAGRLCPYGRTPTGQFRFRSSQVEETLARPTERARDIAIHVQAAHEKLRQLRKAH
jgi:predicted site-specific integrase-resolvase